MRLGHFLSICITLQLYSETGELLLSSSSMLRQRDLGLYVIINKATWLHCSCIEVRERPPIGSRHMRHAVEAGSES